MATIKYQEDGQGNKKIITTEVDGQIKVSCECCSSGCETYPAFPVLMEPDPDDETAGFIQWTSDSANLPDAINFYGTTLSKSGTSYGDTTNGVILEGEKWAVYRNGSRTEKDYLISGGIDDFFADQYTVTWPKDSENNYSTVVTRTSECTWNSSFVADGCPIGFAILSLHDNGWNFTAASFLSGGLSGGGSCYLYVGGIYPNPLNSPTGSWSNEITVS